MAIFTWRTMDELKVSVATMASRLLSGSSCILTPDEFIAAFIEPEHIPVLKQTEGLVGFVGNTSFSTKILCGDVAVAVAGTFGMAKPPIILPNYLRQGVHHSCPDDLRAKIQNWLDERVRLGRMFGDAWDSIYWLNENCGNAAALAVMFPAFTTLMANISSDPDATSRKRAQRIASTKTFGALPKLPREVKNRMLECSDLILTVAMLEGHASYSLKPKHAMLEVAGISNAHDFIYAAFDQKKDASFF